MFIESACFFTNALLPKLRELGIAADVMTFNKKKLVAKLASGEYSSCMVVQLGSGGDDRGFFCADIKMLLTAWVQQGGRLIIQGEGEKRALTVFRDWLGKPWTFRGDFYRRTTHHLNAGFTAVPQLLQSTTMALDQVTSAKACMLSNVDVSERLYVIPKGDAVPEMCYAAVASIGAGRACFIGDVNAERSTIDIIAAVGLV